MLAHVLDQAHARQLFHHALKPTNVFVGFSQGHGIRITDFGAGLARAAVPTQEGYALAAPWLAPEQVQGQVPAGAAADVFATGLLMFFALTGRSYWRSCQGAIDLPGWQRELMSPRTPPSARALQLGAPLSSAFDGVLGCALSVDPSQRYRSVAELAQAFESLVGVSAPESQATMAFPASAFGIPTGSGGGYPPPPRPPAAATPPPLPRRPAPQQPRRPGPPRRTRRAATAAAAPRRQLGTAQYPWGGQEQAQLQPQSAPSAAGPPAPRAALAARRPRRRRRMAQPHAAYVSHPGAPPGPAPGRRRSTRPPPAAPSIQRSPSAVDRRTGSRPSSSGSSPWCSSAAPPRPGW